MSQNRGFRRDGRQSYQVNSSNYGRSMNVNPWEGGLVPGGPRSSVAGLLPTPPQASNLISQLSSPEAQLALASNLLTTLFRPQQQQQQVPSLLSLGALGQMGNVGTGGYRQQSNYGHTQNRYQDRRKIRTDSRRTEPYNKMGNRNRDSQAMQDRRSTPSKGGPERKPGSQGYRSPNIGKARPTKGGAKPDKKDDKEEENEDSDKTNEKKADEEDSKREDGEDGEEKKRDWKDEKKGEDGEDEEGKKDDKDEKDSEKRGGRTSTSKYSGIPNGLFFCHVCKKHMWDDHSFDNHLKGRSHQLMMEKLEESYKIKVDLMRHELQVAEQQREIEMERVKRQGKKVQMSSREYCTMCDLYFFGNIVMHRKTERHQQLKSFLHPRCLPCGKEFPTRVEWDHHKLTALHLRKTAEARKTRKGSDDEFGIEDFLASDDGEKGDIKVRTKEEEENDIIGSDKEKGDDENKDSEENKEESKEYFKAEVDSSGNLRYRIPKYNSHFAVGQSLLKKVVGQICRTCHRFFLHEEDAKTHCRTLSHFQNYIELLKTKAQVLNQERRGALASSKKKEESEKDGETAEDGSKKTDETEEKGKRGIDDVKDDDEGNWKRRKVANANEEDEDATEETSDKVKGENGEEKPEKKTEEEEKEKDDKDDKIPPGQEKYDPLEAENEYENDEKEKPSAEENTESKEKGEDIVDDDNLWAEVDRDIGTLLDTVDGEAEAGSPAGEEDASKTEKGDDSKPATRTRGNATTRGAAASPRGVRGRKKK